MFPRPEPPTRQLPYTTADMAERLAKKKAEQDAAAFKAFPGGVTKPFDQNGGASSPSWLSQLGNMAKSLVLTPAGTLADMVPYVANIPGVKGEGAWGYEPEDAGTSNFFQAGGQALEAATRRAVGDFTAIPRVGEPSASPTAADIKRYGVAEGLAAATLDYGNLALTAAPFVKPANMVIGNAINDAKYAAYLRRTKSPFPDVIPPKPGTFIDVVEGADGVIRAAGATKSPATPASRLAEAQTQRALPPAVQRALPPVPSTQLPPEFLALFDQVPVAPEAAVQYSALSKQAPDSPPPTTQIEAIKNLAENGSLEQLEKTAPQYLWQAIEDNSTASLPNGRFKQIGSGGGWVGMDRYVDQATGKHFGLKIRPGMRQFEAEWHPGPMAEILSNDIAVSLGFPNMNLRLIRNSDDSISIITDLAQDVYGGTIVDSFQAALHGEANNWLPSIASRVLIEDRIRMAVLDDLVNNGDRHSGNILYSVNDDGSVRLVPIDHEVTFQGPGGGTPRRFAQTYEFNVSVRQAYLEDPTKLYQDIKAAIEKIQQELKQKAPDLLENFESKLVQTSEQFGIPRGRYIDRPVKQLSNDLTQFLNDTPDLIAQKYWNQIAEGFQF
jgi:hypothetical protein